jgi:hypothetical protein
MTLIAQVELTKDQEFRQRIRMATVKSAQSIQGEAKGDKSDTEYGKRQDLAQRVIQTAGEGTPEDPILRMFVWMVCANPAILQEYEQDGEVADDSIEFTVNSVWDDCAGVSEMDKPVIEA